MNFRSGSGFLLNSTWMNFWTRLDWGCCWHILYSKFTVTNLHKGQTILGTVTPILSNFDFQVWESERAPKLYRFTILQGIKVLIAGFYTVSSAVLDCKAGFNVVVLLLCFCKSCEHQASVTARSNVIIFQLSYQIPTALLHRMSTQMKLSLIIYHQRGGDQSCHIHLCQGLNSLCWRWSSHL